MLNLSDVKYIPNGHRLQLSLLCRGLEGPTRTNPPSVGNTPTESQDHAQWALGLLQSARHRYTPDRSHAFWEDVHRAELHRSERKSG